jgi:uncharacterized transporter YbjL
MIYIGITILLALIMYIYKIKYYNKNTIKIKLDMLEEITKTLEQKENYNNEIDIKIQNTNCFENINNEYLEELEQYNENILEIKRLRDEKKKSLFS